MGLSPTDGIVTPQLARGLIKAVQIQVGMKNTDNPTEENAADGIWGPGTVERVRDLGQVTAAPGLQWTRLITYGFYVNGFSVRIEDPSFSDVAPRANGFGITLRLNRIPDDNSFVSSLIIAALFDSYGDQDRTSASKPT